MSRKNDMIGINGMNGINAMTDISRTKLTLHVSRLNRMCPIRLKTRMRRRKNISNSLLGMRNQ